MCGFYVRCTCRNNTSSNNLLRRRRRRRRRLRRRRRRQRQCWWLRRQYYKELPYEQFCSANTQHTHTHTAKAEKSQKEQKLGIYVLLNRPKSNFNATKFVWKCQDLRSIRGIHSVVHTPTHSYFMMVLLNQKLHFNLFRIFDKICTLKFFWSFCCCVHSLKNIAFLRSYIQCSMPLGWKPFKNHRYCSMPSKTDSIHCENWFCYSNESTTCSSPSVCIASTISPHRPPIFLFRVFAFLEIVLSTSNVEQWSVLPTGSFTVDMLSIDFNFRCCRIQTHRANDSIPELLVGYFIERIYLNKSDYKHL